MSVATERIIQETRNLSDSELVEVAQWLLKRTESRYSPCEGLADSQGEEVGLRMQHVGIPVTISLKLRSASHEILWDSFVCPSGIELVWRDFSREEVDE